MALPLDDSGGSSSSSHHASSSATQQRSAWLLPPRITHEKDYFDVEAALKLYRKRLPSCNVLLPAEEDEGGGSSSAAPPRRGRGRAGAASSSSTTATKRGRERDFLHDLVFEAKGARTALLIDETAQIAERAVLAACTFVAHPAHQLCELQLLAVRQSKRGNGSMLLRAVERWLRRDVGVRCIVVLAGEDVVEFWRRHGYEADSMELSPEKWALLRDPFGGSKMVAKWV